MKVYTIEKCRDCPSYIPDSNAYYDEYGECGRHETLKVADDSKIPDGCPLKDWK